MLEFFSTESASSCEVLIASFTSVVRFSIALSAEVHLASVASNPILSHMFGCFSRNQLTSVIFGALHDFTRNQFKDVSALAAHKVFIDLHNMHRLLVVDLFQLFFGQILVCFPVLDDFLTRGTLNWFVVRPQPDSSFFKTVNMDLMPTLSGLNEGFTVILFLFRRDLSIAELALSFLRIPLHLLVVRLCPLSFGRVHEVLHMHDSTLSVLLLLLFLFVGRSKWLDLL